MTWCCHSNTNALLCLGQERDGIHYAGEMDNLSYMLELGINPIYFIKIKSYIFLSLVKV